MNCPSGSAVDLWTCSSMFTSPFVVIFTYISSMASARGDWMDPSLSAWKGCHGDPLNQAIQYPTWPLLFGISPCYIDPKALSLVFSEQAFLPTDI